MLSLEIMTTVLTHPFQVLLIGMLVARLARGGILTVTRGRRAPTSPGGSSMRPDPSDLQAA